MWAYFRLSGGLVALRRLGQACLLVLAAAPAFAQDFSADAISKAYPFKDLPGVEEKAKPDNSDDQPNCRQEVRMRRQMFRDRFYDDTSGIVYLCEKDGITLESERPPASKTWNPLQQR